MTEVRIKSILMTAAVCLVSSCGSDNSEPEGNGGSEVTVTEAQVGQPLPMWEEGWLDIHSINSARGECTFYIYPDGTTMLVDAGEYEDSGSDSVPKKPDDSTRPYITYCKYIGHFLPAGHRTIDYALLTHFHIDHMGDTSSGYPSGSGGYIPTGISAVYSMIRYNKLVDRGYPDYTANPIAPASSATPNYIKFTNVAKDSYGLTVEAFEIGSKEQFAMLYKPSAYDFTVRNIAANGYVWQGEGKDNLNGNATTENTCSCSFLIKYGKFDYFAGGDLVGTPQTKVSEYIAANVSRLEACKANHHLSNNAMGGTWLENTAPQVIVNQSFYAKQPDPERLKDIFSDTYYVGRKTLFLTNLHNTTIQNYPELVSQVTAYHGHIVLRVAPGGDEFYVYMLDDTDFSYKVKSIHGPYKCY